MGKLVMGDSVAWGQVGGPWRVTAIDPKAGRCSLRRDEDGAEEKSVRIESVVVLGTFAPHAPAIHDSLGPVTILASGVAMGRRIYSCLPADGGAPFLALESSLSRPSSITVGPPARLWVAYVDAVRALDAAELGSRDDRGECRLAEAQAQADLRKAAGGR